MGELYCDSMRPRSAVSSVERDHVVRLYFRGKNLDDRQFLIWESLEDLTISTEYVCHVCMYVFKYVRRLANIGRQPRGAALQYQKELASGNEIADEWSRGVILKRHEVKGFLKSGMAGLYEVKREPCHIVEHMSTAKTAQRHICSAAQRTNKLVLFS